MLNTYEETQILREYLEQNMDILDKGYISTPTYRKNDFEIASHP